MAQQFCFYIFILRTASMSVVSVWYYFKFSSNIMTDGAVLVSHSLDSPLVFSIIIIVDRSY